MSNLFEKAVVNLLIYIVAYLNDVNMIWNEDKADKLLDKVKDEYKNLEI